MPYKLNDQEMKAVSSLAPPATYEHFLKRIADWQELWAVKGPGGFVGMGDDDGNQGIPFWPHPRYAERHIQGDWSNCTAVRISVEDFMDKWLTGMERDGVKVVAFPTPDMKGVVVEPARMRADLSEKLDEYE